MSITVEPLNDIASDLGEGPLWCVREQALYWIDLTGRRVMRQGANGVAGSFAVSGMPGSITTRSGGGLLAAFRARLAFLDLDKGTETEIPCKIDFAVERFNDGKCDRRGRFFVGTMHKEMTQPIGGLYRVDPDRTVTRVADGITLSNGIAFSPDDRVLYHVESRPGRVYAYDYDIETGRTSNRRILMQTSETGLHPDGCTVDAEGFLWVAEVGHSTVGRYTPEGRRVSEIRLPTKRVTSVMFGGADLKKLYITTMRYNLAPEDVATQPLAGRIFVCRPGVAGLPEVEFPG